MSGSIFHWRVVGREDLLDVLLGETVGSEKMETKFPEYEVSKGMLALGFLYNRNVQDLDTLALLVIEDKYLNEILAWLRVYATEAVPLSQYARVVLRTDYEMFWHNSGELWRKKCRPDRWACVAIGETLAQSDGEADLQSMALSRLSSSFTLPVARTAIYFGKNECTRICVDRLRTIGMDRRFSKKGVSVEQLLAIWAITNSDVGKVETAEEVAYLVMAAAEQHLGAITSKASLHLKNFPGLTSDSVEERVIAFHQLSLEFMEQYPTNYVDNLAPVLAAAAFLVGRSTSHVFLLKRFGKIAPVVFCWFGLLAALSGPRAWDSAWLRAVKGAERLIRIGFSWDAISAADIAWPEFAWLTRTFEGLDQLILLPKMLPRTLAVEVVPGALLHVRLDGGNAEQEGRHVSEPNVREQALQNALSQFVHLAQKVRGMVDPSLISSEGQQSLELSSRRASPPKSGRQRRPKKNPGST